MRACLAILKDSFREAAASRILWIALLGIMVILLALAPLGLSTMMSTQLRPFELVDTERFLKTLQEDRRSSDTPSAHIWSLLSDDEKTSVENWLKPPEEENPSGNERSGPPRRGRIQSQVLDTVNALLTRSDFYKAENWAKVEMDEELKAADTAAVTGDLLAARNLKRLARAFPQSIDIQDETSLSLTYGTMTLFGPLRAPLEQTAKLIDSTIIAILSVFLGFFGVFSSLLVTSTIIPRTFEPGEISLLLSKPVRRSVLFVTKFIGGCAFTLLCASVLVAGVWILLWFRFNLWRPELLLCIPLYVFLFAIYFSVSALAGAIWRNATVSLILVVAFWVVVTTAGAIQGFMENLYIRSQQIVEVTASGGEVFVVDGSKTFSRWDEDTKDWVKVFEQRGENSFQMAMARMLRSAVRTRPVVSPDGQKIASLQPEFSRFGGASPASLVTGEKDSNFSRVVEAIAPDSVFAVFQTSDGKYILPGTRGVYRFVGVSEQARKSQAFLQGLFGGLLPSNSSKAFETLTAPDMESIRGDASVTFNHTDNSIAVWNNGKLSKLIYTEDGKYAAGPAKEFEPRQAAIIAAEGQFILCAKADGSLTVLDSSTLEVIAEGAIPKGDKPKATELSRDGRWGVVMTHSGHIVAFDGNDKKFVGWKPLENASVSAISFDSAGQLIVANGRRSISFYEPFSASPARVVNGNVEWPYRVYDYVVNPLYRVLPKPSELDNAVRYLVTGEKSVVIDANEGEPNNAASEDLNQQRVTFDLWASFWSNLGFIAVMLFAGSVYLIRRDF